MSNPELNADVLTKSVDKAERTFLWFIKNLLRASWFRRCTVVFVLGLTFLNPTSASKGFDLLAKPLPAHYSIWFYIVLTLWTVLTVAVGYFTLPQDGPPPPPGKALRGLLPIEAEESDLFKKLCREVDILKVLTSVRSDRFRFGVLVGTSGSGKTSFLRAGIVPRLKESKLKATYVELSNESPIDSINRALRGQDLKSPVGLLVLDQFEQFFLHQRTAGDRQPLIDSMKQWFARDSGVQVLVSIRAEDAWQMIEVQEAVGYELSNENHFRLLKFDAVNAVEVLAVLSQEAGIGFDSAFAQQTVMHELLDEDGRVSPVNLGIVVLVLASKSAALNADSFKTHGGIAMFLEDWLHSQLDAIRVQQLDTMVIQTLTALCDLETNRRVGALTIEGIAARLNNQLTSAQISKAIAWMTRQDVRLAVNTERSDPPAYQLSHERLIPAIRKVAGKLLNNATRASDLLERRTRAWVENERASRYLLNFFEFRFIRRELPYIFWGENRGQKISLLQSSGTKIKKKAIALAGVSILLIAGYFAWLSNPVQRWYISWRLVHLAQANPSVSAAEALAANGRFSDATNIISNDHSFFDDDEEAAAMEKVYLQSLKTELSKKDTRLLKETSSFAELTTDSLVGTNALCISLVNEGRAREAVMILESIEQPNEELSEAWQAVAISHAREKNFDEALKALENSEAPDDHTTTEVYRCMIVNGKTDELYSLIKSNDDTNTWQSHASILITQLAKTGNWSKARSIVSSLKGNEKMWLPSVEVLAHEYVEVGKFDDAMEFVRQENKAGANAFENEMLAEMAVKARLSNDQALKERVLKRTQEIEWEDGSYDRWTVEAAVGDPELAKKFLDAASFKSIAETQQGHSIPGLTDAPLTVANLAARILDEDLMSDAVDEALDVDNRAPHPAMADILEIMVSSWPHQKCEDFLEKTLRRAPQFKQYSPLISVYMARFGNLNRARELAESYGYGGSTLAQSFAAILLEDANTQRPNYLRDRSYDRRQDLQ